MDFRLLGAFVVALLLVLGLPMLVGAFGSAGSGVAVSAQSSGTASAQRPTAPATTSTQAAAAPAADAAPPIPSIIDAPPMLDETSLIGTAWRVTHKMGAIDVELMGGGMCRATHMLIGAIQGSWRVDGSNVVVTATVMGKTETINVQIRGTNLFYEGVAIARLQ